MLFTGVCVALWYKPLYATQAEAVNSSWYAKYHTYCELPHIVLLHTLFVLDLELAYCAALF